MKRVLCAALAGAVTACGTDASDVSDMVSGAADAGGGDEELAGLDQCLARGEGLTEVTEIDNNVLVAHGEITSFALASTGQMALASTDGAIKLWSVRGEPEGTEKPEVGYDAAFGEDNPPVRSLAYAPDGGWIAAGRESGEVAAWSPSSGDQMESMAFEDGWPIDSVDVSPDGQAIASAQGHRLRLWHRGETEAIDLPTLLWGVAEVHYLPGGSLVTAGHDYGTPALEVREAGDPAAVEWSWGDHGLKEGWLRAAATSPDGSRLAVGGDGLLLLFDLEVPDAEPTLTDVDGILRSLTFSPGGAHVIATDESGAARVFSAGDGREVGSLPGSDLIGVLSRSGWDQLATAEREGILRILGCGL